MNKEILEFYLKNSCYTYLWLYEKELLNSLPTEIPEIGLLLRKNIVHRVTLVLWNTFTNEDLRFWDMNRMPWYRQAEDDLFPTACWMLAELYRRDSRWFVNDRKEEDKLVITCRFVAILMAWILKSKWLPARVRSWNASYFTNDWLSRDHWILEYFDNKRWEWILIDPDGSLSLFDKTVNPYDMSRDNFDFPAKVWLDIRAWKDDSLRFKNAKPETWILVVLWSLFYDFHCLMNNEILYTHVPLYWTYDWFANIKPRELKEIDKLASLMLDPDKNFDKLKKLYNKKTFRILYWWLL